MAHLLQIDCSPRGERSRSRQLTREFVAQWQQTHPDDTVAYRDVGRNTIPHIDEQWIAAAYTPIEQRNSQIELALHLSDQLVDEFLAADLYVIGVPMYNFSIPSALKAYIDQIVRIGRTFQFNPENVTNPYEPLVFGKKMFIISARGGSGFSVGGPYEKLNYQTSYLQTIFGFIGIVDITLVDLENDEKDGQLLMDAIAHARFQIAQVIRG
jgi:FMN-dependent NADH-azoreductase